MSTARQSALGDALGAVRRAFLVVLLFSVGVNLLTLTAPLYMLQLFDRVILSRSTETLLFLTLIAGAALLALGALDIVRNVLLVRTGFWLERRLSPEVLAGGVRIGASRAAEGSIQGLRDLMQVRGFVSSPTVLPLLDMPWVPIRLALVFMLHPLLGLVAVGGVVVLFGLALANELATRKLLEHSSAQSRQALRRAEAAVRNADVIEAMGLLPNLIRGWHRHSAGATALQARAAGRGLGILAASKAIRMALQIGTLGVGGYLVIQGQVTPGVMVASSILAARALSPFEGTISSWRMAVQARSAYRRLRTMMETMPRPGPAMPLPAPSGALEVEGLTYAYPGAHEAILRGVGFRLEPGTALGLIGASAVGKTTLARLIVGSLRPRVGHIRLGGAALAAWSPEDRGQHVGYLPQDVELFEGTVRENIARMAVGDFAAVVAAAEAAGIHEMVLRLPAGYETQIGPGGATLSGGQRQRIALARALYGRPRLVVLDEPAANLDEAGERALAHAIRHLKDIGATLVMTTHHQRMLHLMDVIGVLAGGRLQRMGRTEEMLPGPTSATPLHALPEPAGAAR
jgi:PrtD family type I secretion system ABC transporter